MITCDIYEKIHYYKTKSNLLQGIHKTATQ